MLAVLAILVAASPAAAKAPGPLELRPLHAEPDAKRGGRIVDDRGREVRLRGVNVNALADYWKGSRFPTVFGFEKRDPDRLQAIGFNAVRLLLSWSRVEPEPGVYDAKYLAQAAAIVERLRAKGIYTILDLHQDAWGATLAAPDGTTCSQQSEPALGWDGAPGWATLDDGASRCAVGGIRETSGAVRAAWGSFFADRDGIQGRYVAMLGELARRFATSSAVAGYDLMNEPNAFGDDENAALSKFYARALVAVRAGERRGRGFRHLVLFEPSGLWSSTGSGAPPDFERDRDVVYAPHIYTGGFDGGPITKAAFSVARDEAKGFGGAPVLSGEWGAGPGRAGPKGDGYFERHQALQDQFGVSATLWTWRESCGDPHKVGDMRAGNVPEVWGEFDVDCTTNKVRGERTALVGDLTRGWVRAAPGRLLRVGYDAKTGEFFASGTAPRGSGDLVVFYPPTKRALALSAGGLTPLKSKGGLLWGTPRGGRWSVVISPAKRG